MNFSKERRIYFLLNYSGYALNFFSGLILARELGPFVRGEFSYLSAFFYITLMIAPLNLKNAVSLAISENSNLEKARRITPWRLLIIAFLVTIVLSVFFLSFLKNQFDNIILFSFLVSNTIIFLNSYIQIFEGIYRSNAQTRDLGVLRLIGLGLPSFYVFLLFSFSSLNLQNLLLSQSIATLGCCAYIILGPNKLPKLEQKRIGYLAIKTYPGYALEYSIGILVLISVNLTEKTITLGHFAIAYSFSLIVDTSYPYFESKIYALLNPKASVGNLSLIINKTKSLFASQFVLIPATFLIPIVYGEEYSESTIMAIILIFGKFAYSMVKIMNIYTNVIERKYNLPFLYNFIYFSIYTFFFMYFRISGFSQPWRISLIITSFISMFCVFIFSLRKIHLLKETYRSD